MNRFVLQWLVPRQGVRLTHVMLLDKERPAPFAVAARHGSDKVHALLNLWETLVQSGGSADAIEYVVVEYTRRTGEAPVGPLGRTRNLPHDKPPKRTPRRRLKR